jgi:hypothetical protein
LESGILSENEAGAFFINESSFNLISWLKYVSTIIHLAKQSNAKTWSMQKSRKCIYGNQKK